MDELDRYCLGLRQAGRAVGTVALYRWHIVRFREWCAGRDLDRDLVLMWGAEIMDRWAPATCRAAVVAVRQFLAWSGREDCDVLVLPRVPLRAQRWISVDEMRLMLGACGDSVRGVRDQALLVLMFDTGLRAAEVCRIALSCVELDHLVVTIKGGQRRVVWFGALSSRLCQQWCMVRPVCQCDCLFVSLGGSSRHKALSPGGLRAVLHRAGKRAGVKGVTCHAFRRGFAIEATLAGAPTRMVQLAGRWKDIRQVEQYTLPLVGKSLYASWSPGDRLDDR